MLFPAPTGLRDAALEARLAPWRSALATRPRRSLPSEGFRSAAVLLTLFEGPEGLSSLFVTRAAHLSRHPGQVALPGGMVELGEDAVACALREAEEEVGLPSGWALPLGLFDEVYSPTGARLTPVVAWLPQAPAWRLDPGEVAEAHELPLAGFLAPEAYHAEERELPQLGRHKVHHYRVSGVHVWGVTGHILHEWLAFLSEAVGGQAALARHLKASETSGGLG